MRKFDYSFLNNSLLPANIINSTALISELKTLESSHKKNYAKIFTQLESIAKIQSVKGSNAIEGIITSDKRIVAIVNNSSAPLNHNEEEIAGYRDALNLVHTGYEFIDIIKQDILNLHNTMLSFTNYGFGGKYKTADNAILEISKSGERKVRFAPISAADTEAAMEQLLFAYQDSKNNSSINPLLLIPCVILDFLCIHPFADGNGRMSRLLSLLLLYKNGFDAGKYISFEEQINKNKDAYDESLRLSSLNWHDNTNDYTPFIQNFILTLLMCYRELDKRFEFVNEKNNKTERINAAVLNSLLPISKKEISRLAPDISITTIEAVLSKMLKENKIKKVGDRKSAKYVKNNKTTLILPSPLKVEETTLSSQT
jgi:Fic family protein